MLLDSVEHRHAFGTQVQVGSPIDTFLALMSVCVQVLSPLGERNQLGSSFDAEH